MRRKPTFCGRRTDECRNSRCGVPSRHSEAAKQQLSLCRCASYLSVLSIFLRSDFLFPECLQERCETAIVLSRKNGFQAFAAPLAGCVSLVRNIATD